MATDTFFFEVQVRATDDGERVAGKIHAALLEFAEKNHLGDHPQMEGWKAKNGVWLRWSKTVQPLAEDQ